MSITEKTADGILSHKELQIQIYSYKATEVNYLESEIMVACTSTNINNIDKYSNLFYTSVIDLTTLPVDKIIL